MCCEDWGIEVNGFDSGAIKIRDEIPTPNMNIIIIHPEFGDDNEKFLREGDLIR